MQQWTELGAVASSLVSAFCPGQNPDHRLWLTLLQHPCSFFSHVEQSEVLTYCSHSGFQAAACSFSLGNGLSVNCELSLFVTNQGRHVLLNLASSQTRVLGNSNTSPTLGECHGCLVLSPTCTLHTCSKLSVTAWRARMASYTVRWAWGKGFWSLLLLLLLLLLVLLLFC